MKIFSRRTIRGLYLLCFLTSLCTCGRAQINVTYGLDNARVSEDGLAYEVDVMISTTTPFKFGSGQLYFNYDPVAFGTDVSRNNRIEIITANALLGTVVGFPVYQPPVVNDNTTNRVSVAYLQGTSSGCLPGPNVNATPSLLFTLRLLYAPGQAGSMPTVCLEDQELFANQTFTACGPGAGCGFADCQNSPGTQITEDFFVCVTQLPVELIDFTVRRVKNDAHLNWETAREENSAFFDVEKSHDGRSWRAIGRVNAAGESAESATYFFEDPDFGATAPTAYYRLRMEDVDGSFDYSPIRQLDARGKGIAIRVFPNPAAEQLFVSLEEEPSHPVELSLTSAIGQTVWHQTLRARSSALLTINLSALALPEGVYTLLSSEGEAKRIVVARQ